MNGSRTVTIAIAAMAILCVACLANRGPAVAQSGFGPHTEEEPLLRRQEWTVPSPDPATPAHAVLFRPPGDGPFRLALISHDSTESGVRRLMMVRQPEYPALAAALVARGFAVLVPQRPGHSPTRGPYLEDQDGCDEADFEKSGRATAEAIRAAITFMRAQPFIRDDGTLLVGDSAGGWGALALAADDPPTVARIIAFAPGRGGQPGDRPFVNCAPERLVATAGIFGRGAQVPVTWLVAKNDSFFAPALSRRMVEAYRAAGGQVDFRLLPPSGSEGHWLAERDEGGARLAEILGVSTHAPQSAEHQVRSQR